MNKSLRSSSAASIVVLASILAGCAAPQASSGDSLGMGGRAGDVGLATRAQIALNSNKVPQAIQLAEQAVAKSPTDAGFRALLGNAYFAGGRFRSAITWSRSTSRAATFASPSRTGCRGCRPMPDGFRRFPA